MMSSNSEVVGGDIDIDGLFTFHNISVPRLAGAVTRGPRSKFC